MSAEGEIDPCLGHAVADEGSELASSAAMRSHRRGPRDADDEVAKRFGSDQELEHALRALLEASDHVRKTG